MRVVLGIDAAWTLVKPSGVALIGESPAGWKLIAVQPSYEYFAALATKNSPNRRPSGTSPDPSILLNTASMLAGRAVTLVAIDMPLARTPITKRRYCDNAISKVYGARKCATHSPSALRPGRVGYALQLGFEKAGFPLLTNSIQLPGIIEVYPHPALIELAAASERLPYKVSKTRKYWPDATPLERRGSL
jgi:predicted RNase H-like nuclease